MRDPSDFSVVFDDFEGSDEPACLLVPGNNDLRSVGLVFMGKRRIQQIKQPGLRSRDVKLSSDGWQVLFLDEAFRSRDIEEPGEFVLTILDVRSGVEVVHVIKVRPRESISLVKPNGDGTLWIVHANRPAGTNNLHPRRYTFVQYDRNFARLSETQFPEEYMMGAASLLGMSGSMLIDAHYIGSKSSGHRRLIQLNLASGECVWDFVSGMRDGWLISASEDCNSLDLTSVLMKDETGELHLVNKEMKTISSLNDMRDFYDIVPFDTKGKKFEAVSLLGANEMVLTQAKGESSVRGHVEIEISVYDCVSRRKSIILEMDCVYDTRTVQVAETMLMELL